MDTVIRDLIIYLINNINEEITIKDIEDRYSYNRYYIIRAFKEYTGLTIMEFINKIKVYKTMNPLLYTDNTILYIALENGFNSQEYYSEKFKDVVGLSPIRFRKYFSNIEENHDINELKMKKAYLNELYNNYNELLNMHKNIEEVKVKKLKRTA